MPLYEYRCENPKCPFNGHVTEHFNTIIDRDGTVICPSCSVEMIRVIGATTFRMRPLAKD